MYLNNCVISFCLLVFGVALLHFFFLEQCLLLLSDIIIHWPALVCPWKDYIVFRFSFSISEDIQLICKSMNSILYKCCYSELQKFFTRCKWRTLANILCFSFLFGSLLILKFHVYGILFTTLLLCRGFLFFSFLFWCEGSRISYWFSISEKKFYSKQVLFSNFWLDKSCFHDMILQMG